MRVKNRYKKKLALGALECRLYDVSNLFIESYDKECKT